MVQYPTTAPVVKNYSGVIKPNSRIPTLRDKQALSSDNVTNGVIEFFPPNPTADAVARNYDDNPLPGPYSKRIIGLGFSFSYPVLQYATNVDPVIVVNALKHSAVVLSRGDRRTQVIRAHMTQFIDFNKVEAKIANYNDGTNDGSLLATLMRTVPLKRLAESKDADFVLAPDERFVLEVEPDNASLLPSDSDWGNAGSGALSLYSFIQVVHRHNP